MTEHVRFFVSGVPVPKQSFRMGKGHGYTDPRVAAWAAAVQSEAMRYIQNKIPGNVFVKMNFYMPNNRRVDLDNLSKNVLDSVKDICFEDDCMVTKLLLTKSVCPTTPGVLVTIKENLLDEIDKAGK